MMSRIRTVKPELFNHEGLFEAEQHYQLPLRLAFIALFTCCDREGRFRWQPRRLKLDILPYDNVDISRVLDALVTRRFIVKYEYQGEFYGCIPSWSRHQHINHREGESALPSLEVSTIFESEKINTNNDAMIEPPPVIDASGTGEAPVTGMPGGKGREGKGKGREGNRSFVASGTRHSDDSQHIQNIFAHWKTVMNHPSAHLDSKRKAIITKALKFGYSPSELCEAITGCSYTPHNIGDNERGQRYDGLHIILRDGDQIDRFIHNFQYPPHPVTDSDRRSMANVKTLQTWMSKKIEEEK